METHKIHRVVINKILLRRNKNDKINCIIEKENNMQVMNK